MEVRRLVSGVLVLMMLIGVVAEGGEGDDVWPGFRGDGQSHAEGAKIGGVVGKKGKVEWEAKLSGYGQSSPLIRGGRVYVTGIEGEMQDTLVVGCYGLKDGKRVWEKRFKGSQGVKSSDYVSKAAPTGAVDKGGVYVFFETGDLLGLDHKGEVRWRRSLVKEFGKYMGNHGVGASLAQSGDSLYVLIDHAGPGYLMRVLKDTGKTKWKVDREKRVSWSSPIVSTYGGKEEVLVSSNGVAEAFDAGSGKRKWVVTGLEKNTVCSPTVGGGMVIVGSSAKGQSIAIRRGGKGDVTKTHVAWTAEEASATFGSPLVYQGRVYFVNRAGVAFCNELKTGKSVWTLRLAGSCWASPISSKGVVYFACKTGDVFAVKAGGEEGEVLGKVKLDIDPESRLYGVGVAGGRMVLRSGEKLFCLKGGG